MKDDETIVAKAISASYYLVFGVWILFLYYNSTIGSIAVEALTIPSIWLSAIFMVIQFASYALLAEKEDRFMCGGLISALIYAIWMNIMYTGITVGNLILLDTIVIAILSGIIGFVIAFLYGLILTRLLPR